MNRALFEIGLTVLMLAVSGFLLVWFWRYRAAGSQRRMAQMLARGGVAPEMVSGGDVGGIKGLDRPGKFQACSHGRHP